MFNKFKGFYRPRRFAELAFLVLFSMSFLGCIDDTNEHLRSMDEHSKEITVEAKRLADAMVLLQKSSIEFMNLMIGQMKVRTPPEQTTNIHEMMEGTPIIEPDANQSESGGTAADKHNQTSEDNND
jgi:hypothetical protein